MKDQNCIFCKIANKEISVDPVLETDDCIAFNDINPQAPFHVLVIPKKHYSCINDIDDDELIAKLIKTARETAKKLNIEDGYRLVINTGSQAGQTVFHVHIHILGGRPLLWPPG